MEEIISLATDLLTEEERTLAKIFTIDEPFQYSLDEVDPMADYEVMSWMSVLLFGHIRAKKSTVSDASLAEIARTSETVVNLLMERMVSKGLIKVASRYIKPDGVKGYMYSYVN